jgi:hypothetical protein
MAKPTKTSGEDTINIYVGSKGILTKMQITIELKSVCGTPRGYPVDDNAKLFTRLTRSRTLDESDIETIRKLGFEVVLVNEDSQGREHA